ncbi:Hypothetical protein SMAX5B_006622 [Scophthalmus maximus]|uniref:Uncharacterized protein n=1 Tax=Scophthalmus maximus TaxID=52904 RepID=A0A2U9BJE6_SCOMX|nr:Hypothetical protein SMAX5B_006622 [Scophthalmus maximus]
MRKESFSQSCLCATLIWKSEELFQFSITSVDINSTRSTQTTNQQPVMSLNASREALLLNLTPAVFEHRQLLQLSRRMEEEAYFVDYIPPARDAITLPRNAVYVLVGVVLVIVATYAIVGHLIKDLMHDLADWILGPKPVEDDSEEGRAEIEEERLLSVSSKLMGKDRVRMEKEKDGLLPGFHQADGDCRHPPAAPPLRSAIASSYLGEKRISTHSVTFACPVTPYITSI